LVVVEVASGMELGRGCDVEIYPKNIVGKLLLKRWNSLSKGDFRIFASERERVLVVGVEREGESREVGKL
jgi:hypothetical protein